MKQALRKGNIDLVNSWQDSSGVQHGEVTIGGLSCSLQFPWPLDINGNIQLTSNQKLPVPDIRDFAGRLTRQVGISGLLPPLHLVGLGDFGFSIETLVISFNKGNLSSIEIVFNIPGWDALNKFGFKVVQPKLNVKLSFRSRTLKWKAKGFLVSINQVHSLSDNKGLPIVLNFPKNEHDSLEISVADTNAVVEFKSLVPLLASRMAREILEAINDISQNITVPKLNLRVSVRLSNISIVNMKTVSISAFSVFSKMVLNNATLELTETGYSFDAAIYTCGQQLLVTMLKDTSDYLTFEATREEMGRNTSVSIRVFLSCVEEIKDRRPEINFMRMNVSSYEFRLQQFEVKYKLRPKLELDMIAILVTLPSEWNVFNRSSVTTKLLNSTLSVQVTFPRRSPSAHIKAEVFGQVTIGSPLLIDFPFVIKIPTRAKPLVLSLQETKTIKVNFTNLSKLGTLSDAFPTFLKTILTGLLVTKLELLFSASLSGSFTITALQMEIPSNTRWNLPYFNLSRMRITHTLNHTLVSGQIILGNFSLPCHLNWPPTDGGPVIALSMKSLELRDVSSFVKGVYRTFYGTDKIQDISSGLRRTKLSVVSSFSLEKALFHLSSNLSVAKVELKGVLRKYSWELLDDFFGVTDIFISVDVDVGTSFVIFIRGMIVLVDGSANIPFEMNVPLSRNQTLTISLPKNQEPRISFPQLTGMLATAARCKFPIDLGSSLPELILQKQVISFDEKLTEFEFTDFKAVRSTSWDLGGIGALAISNVTVSMNPQFFKLRGLLSLGHTILELELTNSSYGQAFRLVKPTNAFGLEPLVKDALKKMIPDVERFPDVSLLGLNVIDGSSVQFAEVQLSNNFDSLYSFDLTIKISKTWSFFQSSFSLIAPTMNLRVKDLSDVPSYTLDVTGSLEFVNSNNRLVLPLECNIPESRSSMITLKLQHAVIFNLSNIADLPLVGQLIPPGLLSPISDIIGNVRRWPLEAHFEPSTARLDSLIVTATALRQWKMKGLPLAMKNVALDMRVGHSFYATLRGEIFLKAKPISFRIPFPSTLPKVIEMKMDFQEFPEITMTEIGKQFIGGFSLESLFPPVFEQLKISIKELKLRLLPPLKDLQMQSFSLRFSLKNQITIIDNWLRISDTTAHVSVITANKVSVAGRLACLITLGTGDNVMQVRGKLAMPHFSSQAWELSILSEEANHLSAGNIVVLTGGGFDLKALFPDQILSKADKFVLKSFKAAFDPKPPIQIFNITCSFRSKPQRRLASPWNKYSAH